MDERRRTRRHSRATGVGVLRQSDGDAAHVRQIDEVAPALEERLVWEEARR